MRYPYVLVGDIGGTRARLQLFERENDRALKCIFELELQSQEYSSFDALLTHFLRAASAIGDAPIGVACLSVAGPVERGATKLTNLDWQMAGTEISTRFNIREVVLVNDFAAVGLGISELEPQDLVTLQEGSGLLRGARLAIGAGTGLGVCALHWQNGGYIIHPSEGGHADFAPIDELQDLLLNNLRQGFGRVSYERVVSGPGLMRIFHFLQNTEAGFPSKQLLAAMQRGDPAAAISEYAMDKRDPLAVRTLDLFVEIYGEFAGNLALVMLSRGGVYLAGGIAPQILRKLNDGSFLRSFVNKGRFSDFLRTIPVHVVMNHKVGLLGANLIARQVLARVDQ